MTEVSKIKVIATGSTGNAYLIQASGEKLLLECGISANKIKEGLDFDISGVVGCLVTHSHMDHCKAIREVSKWTKVFTSKGTLEEVEQALGECRNVKIIEHNTSFNLGGFTITPFNVEHDTKEPLGFLIYHKSLGKVLFVTDTYYLKYRFNNVDHILIECNYSEQFIDKLPAYRARVLKSHMSLETLKDTLKTWDLKGTMHITLIHLSKDNGDAEYFKTEIQKHTGKVVNIAVPGLEV